MAGKLLVRVRVQPSCSKNEFGDVVDGMLRVRTTAPPADGRANEAVAVALARAFGVPPSRVILKRGATSRQKTYLVEGPARWPDWADRLGIVRP